MACAEFTASGPPETEVEVVPAGWWDTLRREFALLAKSGEAYSATVHGRAQAKWAEHRTRFAQDALDRMAEIERSQGAFKPPAATHPREEDTTMSDPETEQETEAEPQADAEADADGEKAEDEDGEKAEDEDGEKAED